MRASRHIRSRTEVERLLRERGVLPTPQRVEIAAVLLARPQHLSADQVLAAVNAGGETVSKATVYNTLALLVDKGLVREVIVDASRVFYDSNTAPHHHLYHTDTGVITDIDPGQLELPELPELPAGTVCDGVDVIVRVRRATGG